MSDFASAIVKSMKTHKRVTADFYPTPVDATQSMIPALKAILPEGSHVLEPACGDGRLSRVLLKNGYEVTSADLHDRGFGEAGVDFLNGYEGQRFDAVVTNPPFKHAEEFLEKALTLAPVVVFFLKATYWHADSRYDLFQRNRPALVLPLTFRPAFLKKERGSSPLMDCTWYLWFHSEYPMAGYEPIRKIQYDGYGEVGIEAALRQMKAEVESFTNTLKEATPWLVHQKES